MSALPRGVGPPKNEATRSPAELDCRVEHFEKKQPPSFTANFPPTQEGNPRTRCSRVPFRQGN